MEAPRVGASIEILTDDERAHFLAEAPRVGASIEIALEVQSNVNTSEAPRVGASIEIPKPRLMLFVLEMPLV